MLQSLFQKNNTPDTRRPTASRSPVPPKLTLLITIVNREKGDSYLAMLQSFEVNFQLAMAGQGTASAEILKYLGLSHPDKAVIFSVIREDRADAAMHFQEEKFRVTEKIIPDTPEKAFHYRDPLAASTLANGRFQEHWLAACADVDLGTGGKWLVITQTSYERTVGGTFKAIESHFRYVYAAAAVTFLVLIQLAWFFIHRIFILKANR